MGPLRGIDDPIFSTPVFVAFFAGSAAKEMADKAMKKTHTKQTPRNNLRNFILTLRIL